MMMESRERVTRHEPESTDHHGSQSPRRTIPFVQRTLEVGRADDPLEREAEETAKLVMRRLNTDGWVEPEAPRRAVRRLPSGGDDQTTIGPDGGSVDAATQGAIASSTGVPLESQAQSSMESAFGADFSQVRIHTGPKVDHLNERLGARAFTSGSDVFVRSGDYSPATSAGQRLLAHELTHVVQQGAAEPALNPIRRNGDDVPVATVVKRSDHAEALETIASTVVPGVVSAGRTQVRNYLANGLGAGGAKFWRSSELKAFRAKMKSAARAQAYADIEEHIDDDDLFQESGLVKSTAMQDFLAMSAMDEAYGASKKSVDAQMRIIADNYMATNWNYSGILSQATVIARDAAWEVLKVKPAKKRKAAQKAALAAVKRYVAREVLEHTERARVWKNKIVKPEEEQQQQATQDQSVIEQAVTVQTAMQNVGLKSLKKVIKATSAGGALRHLGGLLDQVIPLPGEQVALSVEFQIPIGATPGYVSIKVEGKAGRGITGFSTTGVTTLGEKKRLEVMAQLSFGVGAETFGLKGDFSVGFFTRAGSDKGTGAAMSALSYGAYQAATSLTPKLGNWWAGSGKGTDIPADQRAEMWAAAIESDVFDADENAFADVGASVGVSGGLNAGVFTLDLAAAGEAFKRYDKDMLKASLDSGDEDLFAQAVSSPEDAAKRRQRRKGRTVTSKALSAAVGVKILGQSVGFGGSWSAEHSGDEDTMDAWNNWGIEINAAIGMSAGSMNAIEKIAAGIVAGSLGIVQSLIASGKKGKAGGPTADVLADVTKIIDAGLETEISTALGDLWSVSGSKMDNVVGDSATPIADAGGIGTSSEIQAAITFGLAGGKLVFRFELRDSKSLDISFGAGSAGVSISASKGRRLLALGYEDGGFAMEALGLRAGKNQ